MKTMLSLGASFPIGYEEFVDYSFADEYNGPPVLYNIPMAFPVEFDRIPDEIESVPVASEVSSVLPDSVSVPVVHPLHLPEPVKKSSNSPTSVIDGPQGETSGGKHSPHGGVDGSNAIEEPVAGVLDDEITRDESAASLDFGSRSFASIEEEAAPTGRVKRPALVTFEDEAWEIQGASLGAENFHAEGQERRGKKGSCHNCGRGNRFTEKEVCLVCDAKYCSGCIIAKMGSMPEGRKCVSCIGQPIEESKRERLGKSSRMLRRLFSSLEIHQAMKAERQCEANQMRPEHVCVNGRPLSPDDMVLLQTCPNPPTKLKPGSYWYDKESGFWGKEGHKPHKIISPHLNVGGSLMENASNGNAGIFINDRQITKSELTMLQFAGVQCAGAPHFWVYADGSYQEEGQKNTQGNLWSKTRMKLVCSFLSLPYPSKEAHVTGEEVIGRAIPDYIEQRSLVKLLLVGYHGSGTSTIFKQAKFLYRHIPFLEEERESIKIMIQSNIYHYLGLLLEGRECFEEECLSDMRMRSLQQQTDLGNETTGSDDRTLFYICPKLKSFSDLLLNAMQSGSLEALFPAATREYAPIVEELWNSPAIQATYNRRNELQSLPSVASYFLERVVEMSRVEYEPSDMDILYADGITSSNGLAYTEFLFPRVAHDGINTDESDQHGTGRRYQLIRVQTKGLAENCKWLEMFEDVRMVIFCVALTDYTEYCADASGTKINKMLASKKLFESIAAHPTFIKTDFLLVLNKYDLLEQRIEQSPLTLCDWFDDYNPVTSRHRINTTTSTSTSNIGTTPAQQAFHYIAVKFKKLFSSLNDRRLYVTMADGLDSDSVDDLLRYSREILDWEEDRAGSGNGECSAFGTEQSSSFQ